MGNTRIGQVDRRTVLKLGGSAVGATVIGGGALIHGSQSATAASNGIDTTATVELDSNQRDVTGVTIAPEIGFEWSDFSNGVSNFELDVKVSPESGLTESSMNELLPDSKSIAASNVVTDWNNQSTGGQVDVVNSSQFETDGGNNGDVSDVTTGSDASFDDASGLGTVNLTEQSLMDSFSSGVFPQGIGDGEAAGTRVSVDITLDVRNVNSNSSVTSEATVDFDTVEYGVIIDNPSSGATSGDMTMNSDVTGA